MGRINLLNDSSLCSSLTGKCAFFIYKKAGTTGCNSLNDCAGSCGRGVEKVGAFSYNAHFLSLFFSVQVARESYSYQLVVSRKLNFLHLCLLQTNNKWNGS